MSRFNLNDTFLFFSGVAFVFVFSGVRSPSELSSIWFISSSVEQSVEDVWICSTVWGPRVAWGLASLNGFVMV